MSKNFRTNRLNAGPRNRMGLASPRGRVPCLSPIQQISRPVPAERVKDDPYDSGFCHTRYPNSLPRLAYGRGEHWGQAREWARAEASAIGGITTRNPAKTISSTG